MDTILVRTKSNVPVAHFDYLARPRLNSRLDGSLAGRVTTVCAQAGSGKTSLVASWVASLGRAAYWLSLDSSDNDPVRFVSSLSAATQQPALIPGLRSDFVSYKRAHYARHLLNRLLGQLAERTDEMVLVLDDYQEVDSPEIHELVALLLQNQPEKLHLFLVSRKQLPLPLSKLRARGELGEIGEGDLSFSEEELNQVLNEVMHLNLTRIDIRRLSETTEGWITGVLLAAHSLRRLIHPAEKSSFIGEFGGENWNVFDYLLEEVIAGQARDVRDFLMYNSILECICGPLCDALTDAPQDGHSQEILECIEREHLFMVPLDQKREWYRYHPLFRRALLTLLSRTEPSAIPALHLRASLWYEHRGQLEESIEQTLLAGEWERAADLIELRTEQDLFIGDMRAPMRWLSQLPREIVVDRPQLCLLESAALLITERARATVKSERSLRLVERALLDDASKPGFPEPWHQLTSARATAIAALLSLNRGDPLTRSAEMGRRAARLLAPRDEALSSFIEVNLASLYLQLGDDAAAARASLSARRAARASSNASAEILASFLESSIALLHANLPAAEELCRDALAAFEEEESRNGQVVPAAGVLHVQLGAILLERNRLHQASAELERGDDLLQLTDEDFRGETYLAQIRLKWAVGDVREVVRLTQRLAELSPESASYGAVLLRRLVLTHPGSDLSLPPGLGVLPSNVRVLPEVTEATGLGLRKDWGRATALAVIRLLLGEQRMLGNADLSPALRYLDGQRAVAAERRWTGWLIELQLLRSLVLAEIGAHDAAIKALAESLTVTAGRGYLRLFLDEGPAVIRLLAEISPASDAGQEARRVLDAIATDYGEGEPNRGPRASKSSGSLTVREFQVLELLAEGSSNADIASKLFLSGNTVKTHVSNIFLKLQVRSRTQAVRRAQALGFLS